MQTTKRLDEILLERQVKLLLPQEVVDKIKYTCRKINSVEWSGVLFYKQSHSITEVHNPEFVLEVKDFLLMHRGTQGYTEYELDSDVTDYLMDKIMEDDSNKHLKLGHIHSHNNMAVFFSGTDIDELHDNSDAHNYYLSLIVNNTLDMKAKLVYRARVSEISATKEDGEKYPIKLASASDSLMIHDCEIVGETLTTIPDSFKDRVKFVIDKPVKQHPNQQSPNDNKKKDDYFQHRGPNYGNKNHQAVEGFGKNPHFQGSQKSLPQKTQTSQEEERWGEGLDGNFFTPEQLDNREIDVIEAFTCYILRQGEKFPDDDIEVALQAMQEEGATEANVAKYIIENYADLYTKFFNNMSDVTLDDYADTITDVIDQLDDWTGRFAFLGQAIRELEEFRTLVEQAWKEPLRREQVN